MKVARCKKQDERSKNQDESSKKQEARSKTKEARIKMKVARSKTKVASSEKQESRIKYDYPVYQRTSIQHRVSSIQNPYSKFITHKS